MLAPHACVRPAPHAQWATAAPASARPALARLAGRRPARRCFPLKARAEEEAGAATPDDNAPPPGLLREMDGSVMVRDDLDALLTALPEDIRSIIAHHPHRPQLLEVVLDLGRRPEARFLGGRGGEFLRDAPITWADLQAAEAAVGTFGGDNRAGVEGTLHRISAIRNRRGSVIGLTCRVGRAVTGHISLIRDILTVPNSILFLGKPGVGKTTVIREMARVLADELHKRVVIVDTSNEIGGDGDVPHPAIGGARRMQVPDPSAQHRVMVEAVENHMPEVVIVDEIGTEAEALACRTIAERGVQLVGTAHGQLLENLMKNPTLSDLVGGIQSVTLGDDEARARGTQKSVLERRAPPTFPLVIEMRDRALWVTHWVEDSVDCLLHGKVPVVQVRRREIGGSGGNAHGVVVDEVRYDTVDDLAAAVLAKTAEAAAAAAAPAPGPPPPSATTTASFDDELSGYVPAPDGSPPTAAEPYAWAAAALRDVPDTDALAGLAAIQGSNGGVGTPTSASSFTPPGRAAASASAANHASISELLVNGTGTGRRGKRRAK